MRNCSLMLLLLAGCSFAPRHSRPAMPTPQEFPADSSAVAEGTDATTLGWAEFFADPRLRELIGAALDGNRDLRIAFARIDEARGVYRIEGSARLPNVAAQGDVTRSGGAGETSDRYGVAVGVTAFELDLWGRVRNLSEAARAQYLATEHGARAVRLSLIGQVASTYFAWLEARERIALAEATLTSRREGLEIATTRYEAGITSALDFRQSQVLLTQAETELAGLRLSEAQASNALAVLVGGPLPASLPAPLAIDAQFADIPLAPGLPSTLLTARPDLMASEELLRASRANIGAARAAFLPAISLTGLFGFASDALGSLFSDDSESWTYGGSITAPIFSGGRLRGNLKVASARERIALAEYERSIQQAFREVADGLAGRQLLAEQVTSQERAVLAQHEISELAQLRYQEGVASYLEVLDAARSAFAAEQGLVQLRRFEAENLVALYLALGGGNLVAR